MILWPSSYTGFIHSFIHSGHVNDWINAELVLNIVVGVCIAVSGHVNDWINVELVLNIVVGVCIAVSGHVNDWINVQILLNIAVCVAIGLRAGGFGVRITAEARFFSSPKCPNGLQVPHNLTFNGHRISFLGEKWSGREVFHAPPSTLG
jgi:hypothetical protein